MEAMEGIEKYGSTWLGRLFDRKAKAKKQKAELDRISDESCTCSVNYQSIGCTAYESGKCMWHPSNDPYGLKDREWVDGKFVKKNK